MTIRGLKYLCTILLFATSELTAQTPSPSLLESITIDDGLSQGYISTILQDSKGFMWFGTLGGLNRYDGYDFKVYQFQPNERNSLSGNNISAVYEDQDGFIWVGTWGQGVNVLDPKTEKVYRIEGNDSSYRHLKELDVWKFLQDAHGHMWIGGQTPTGPYGLFRLKWDPQKLIETTENIDLFELDQYQLDPDSLPQHNDIFALHIDATDRLWVGTALAFYSTDLTKHSIAFDIHNDFLFHENMPYSGVFSILEEDDLLWLGRSGTIQSYNMKTGDWDGGSAPVAQTQQVWVEQLNLDEQGHFWFVDRWGRGLFTVEKDSISGGMDLPQASIKAINSVYVDRSNVVWMGRTSRGLYKFSPRVNQFNPLTGLFNAQKQAYINHIHEDNRGRLWANNQIVNRQTGAWHKPDFISQRLNGFRYATVDSLGTLWAMRTPGQLWAYNLETGQERFFNFDLAATPDGPILVAPEGLLWWGSKGVLHRYNTENKRLSSFPYDPTVASNPVGTFNFVLSHGKGNYLWMGSQQGLVRFDMANERIKVFRQEPGNTTSLSGNRVLSVLDDLENPKEFLWVGTEGGGLNRVHKITGTAEHFTTEEGLPDNTVYGILSDDNGHLWLSTNRGLSRFNTQTKTFRNYDQADGLQNNEFNRMAYFKSSSGELFFAGVNGINSFYPDEIKDNPHIPTVVITEFRVGNQPVSHLDSISPLKESISTTKEIHLTYEQNMISFVYASLDYVNPGKNQYAYQMLGLSDQWIVAGNSRLANFTNLDPGTYTFRVKGSNNDGLWNEAGVSIKVIIAPPWWRTWWAYALYILLFLFISSTITVIQLRRTRLRNQLQLEQQNAQNVRDLERAKSQFFSNITHEFRTPLTLILGPVEELIGQGKNVREQKSLLSIQRQAKQLLRLINELLDFNKLENQKMPLKLRHGDLVAFVQDIANTFRPLADQRKIKLTFEPEMNKLELDFDAEKLEKIAHNLLSNAIKFTEAGGKIQVKLSHLISESENYVRLSVIDTGSGIPANEIPNIFNRFYQVNGTKDRYIEGSGIGLALSKELAQLMGGDIEVSSTEQLGSEFTLGIPFKVSDNEVTNTIPRDLVALSHTMGELNPNKFQTVTEELTETDKDLILLVEDHQELRDFIKSRLQSRYIIIEAANGQQGLEEAQEQVPDLIITDVMMPKIDGYEFCKRVKQDQRTSHIPVIMLTAKSTLESRILGLEEGADAYLTKPFSNDELQVRIRKLLEGRRSLQEKFQNRGELEGTFIASPALNREHTYLTRAEGVVEKFLDDPNFDVEAFCSEMGMSRTQLHRKLKALTNQSTTGFVRAIRLKTAKKLLQNGAGNVTEVAYAVGFSSQTYFSRCFQEKFGFAPSEVKLSGKSNRT